MIECKYSKTVSGVYCVTIDCMQYNIGTINAHAVLEWSLNDEDGLLIERGKYDYTGKEWIEFAKNFNSYSWLIEQANKHGNLNIQKLDDNEIIGD